MISITIDAHDAHDARKQMAELLGGPRLVSPALAAQFSGEQPQPSGDIYNTTVAQVFQGSDEIDHGATGNDIIRDVAGVNDTAPKRVRGQPSPGKARRTKAEIAEDDEALRVEATTVHNAIVADVAATASVVEDSPEVQAADAADEAAETVAAKVDGKLTLDDVRNALGGYVNKFGMAAAQADGPQLIAKVLGVPHDPAAPKKISDLGDDQVLLKRAVDGVAEMIAKDPFKRAVAS